MRWAFTPLLTQENEMAVFNLVVKAHGRRSGRTATASAAYRAAQKIVCNRLGITHDYSRKSGVAYSEIMMPGGVAGDRSDLWNRIEQHHRRRDAVTHREIEIALPASLSDHLRRTLALTFGRDIANKYGVACDVAIHMPREISDGELERNPSQYYQVEASGRKTNGNWHAHILISACHVMPGGELGKKSEELCGIHCQRRGIENLAEWGRRRWEELANAALSIEGSEERIDRRSLKTRGVDREPNLHLGPAAFNFERRTGKKSGKRLKHEKEIAARVERERMADEIEKERTRLRAECGWVLADIADIDRQLKEIEQRELARLKLRKQLESFGAKHPDAEFRNPVLGNEYAGNICAESEDYLLQDVGGGVLVLHVRAWVKEAAMDRDCRIVYGEDGKIKVEERGKDVERKFS